MPDPETRFQIIHIYGTPFAPAWDRYGIMELLADEHGVMHTDSDQLSPLGRPDEPKKKIPYTCALQREKQVIYTIMNDTAHVHIDNITFGGRRIDVQLLLFTWFDYFQDEQIKELAKRMAEQATESSIPHGLIIDVTPPKKITQVTHAWMRDGKYMGASSTYIDIPEGIRFNKPDPEHIPIFMELLDLDCPYCVIDREESPEKVQQTVETVWRRYLPHKNINRK